MSILSNNGVRDDDPLPSVTPWMLRDVDRTCALRLRLTHERRTAAWSPYARGRLTRPLREAVLDAHAELRVPERRWFGVPSHLLPEERHTWERAVDGYLALFGDQPARAVPAPLAEPTRLPRRRVTLGGEAGILVETGGGPELRRLGLGRRPCADPLQSWDALVAVLRLTRWLGDRTVRLVDADLLLGVADTQVVEPSAWPHLGAVLDERLARLRERIADARAEPGVACGWCDHVAWCPAHRTPAPVLS